MPVHASDNVIKLDFYCQAVRCRETIHLPPTKPNLKYAESVLHQIKHEIALTGKVDYSKYFPNSRTKAAKIFGSKRSGDILVEDALWQYFENMKRSWKHSTAESNKQIIQSRLVPAFQGLRLSELSVGHIKEWMNRLPCSEKSINNMLIPLRGMLKDSFADGLIDKNPMDRVFNLKINTRSPQPFTPEERTMIIDAAPDQASHLFQFAFFTGLRTGELIALRWSDIDWKRRVVQVRRAITRKVESPPKTKASIRDVTLFKPALDALNKQKPFTMNLNCRIFHNPRTNAPWIDDGQIRKRYWTPALKKAGIDYREPYQMRHTYASQLVASEEPIMWIAKQMGHRDPSVLFDRYARWVPEMYQGAGDKISKVWS